MSLLERFRQLLEDLQREREGLPLEEEAARVVELEQIWNSLTSEEQDLLELQ